MTLSALRWTLSAASEEWNKQRRLCNVSFRLKASAIESARTQVSRHDRLCRGLHERFPAHGLAAFHSLRAGEADFDDSVARFEAVEDQVHGTIRPARRGARTELLDDVPAIDCQKAAQEFFGAVTQINFPE